MPDSYLIRATNPNDQIGGGGSLTTGIIPDLDHEGPWILFPRVSTEFDTSPWAVLSVEEARRIVKEYDAGKLEVAAGGDELPERLAQRRVLTREETGLPVADVTPLVKLG